MFLSRSKERGIYPKRLKYLRIAEGKLPFLYWGEYSRDYSRDEIKISNILSGKSLIERLEKRIADLKQREIKKAEAKAEAATFALQDFEEYKSEDEE